MGYSLNEMGRYEEAIPYFDRALAINPRNVKVLTSKAIALRELGNFKEALRLFDEALGINAINAFVQYNRAITLRKLGRNADAKESVWMINFPPK